MVRRHTSSNPVSVKAALYARVSTDDGRQTVANQVRQLRELAVAREFEIFREYTDEETGASPSRTAFLALLRDARLRRFRVLLITDLDRLTREGAAAGLAAAHWPLREFATSSASSLSTTTSSPIS
jgi:DNA invertase Pin-like site-specific DNA recombinase